MKIVFLDAATVGDTSLAPIARLGELVCYDRSTPAEARERVGDCDVLIVNKVRVDAGLLDAAPALKLVCEAATGVNNIDVETCEKRGIPVRNVAGYSTDSVVQETFMHMLSLLGEAPYFDRQVKSGAYSRSGLFTDVSRPFIEMTGKTLGIIGMGTIGQKVASVATAFGMRVIYFSTSGTGHCKTYPCVDLDTLLGEADVVSIHAPLNVRTQGLLKMAELRKMKPTAFLINMGRGGIVDEADLAGAVDGGVIAGAALDVFTAEPLPADHPFLQVKHPERFRFTPHTAWASVEARERLVAIIAENIAKGW
ncbi:MAG: D-2-hydroxyacid dehydrogenase [Bacteroidales bacterium]|nr:D-2-hydroxyacid dehydrogenase [Bacteroidales bacterium]